LFFPFFSKKSKDRSGETMSEKGFDREARDIIESSISTLVLLYPLYGTVFLYLNKKEDKRIPTMGVGTTRRVDLALYYNPEFVKKLTYTQLRAVLKHEALHVLLHHISRNSYFNYNMRAFNFAADMAINCHIEGLPDNCLFPSKFGLPDNEASEWYYEKLKKESDDKGEGALDGKGDLVDSHEGWGECDDEIIKEKVRNISEQAIKAQESKGWGDVPGNLAQQIIAANKAVVNWKREVRYFINQIIMMGSRPSRMKPNRRFGYLNPGHKKDYVSRILVAIDTSGSVSDQELQYFLQEINGMISHVKVDLLQFDHTIKGDPVPFEKRASKLDIVGRGGTCVDPVLTLADKLNYDGLIIMTDGGFSIGVPKPKCRVMWCGVSANEKCFNHITFGKKVMIEQKKT
jgi:predicted metal-dependent peptidase